MNATLTDLLEWARQKAGDIDPLAVRYSDLAYLQTLRLLLRELAARKQLNFSDLTLELTEGSESLTPEPTDLELSILATRLAHGILTQEYRRRVSAGEIGISWKSGLEEESTIQAVKAYQSFLDVMAQQAEELLAIGIAEAGTGGFRAQ